MDFEWSVNEVAQKTATLYATNITLNKAASAYFDKAQYALLGIDRKKNILGIKPIEKKEVDTGMYAEEQLHRISIGKSYGRISNKHFMDMLADQYQLPLDTQKGLKYKATFDVVHQVLLIQL